MDNFRGKGVGQKTVPIFIFRHNLIPSILVIISQIRKAGHVAAARLVLLYNGLISESTGKNSSRTCIRERYMIFPLFPVTEKITKASRPLPLNQLRRPR